MGFLQRLALTIGMAAAAGLLLTSAAPLEVQAPPPSKTVILYQGFNLIAYDGPTVAVEEALGNVLPQVASIFLFDTASQTWVTWSAALPPLLP